MGGLRGLKDTRVPMALAMLGYWVFGISVAVLLGFELELGGLGVWLGLAMGLTVDRGSADLAFPGHDPQLFSPSPLPDRCGRKRRRLSG